MYLNEYKMVYPEPLYEIMQTYIDGITDKLYNSI